MKTQYFGLNISLILLAFCIGAIFAVYLIGTDRIDFVDKKLVGDRAEYCRQNWCFNDGGCIRQIGNVVFCDYEYKFSESNKK